MFLYLREMEAAAADTLRPQTVGRLSVAYLPDRRTFVYTILDMPVSSQEAVFYFSGFRDGKFAKRRT